MTRPSLSATSAIDADAPIAEELRFYIVRGDNIKIPLIPADQLPFLIHGVPRELNYRQLSQGKWQFVTETDEPASMLRLQQPTLPKTPDLVSIQSTTCHRDKNMSPLKTINKSSPAEYPVLPDDNATESREQNGQNGQNLGPPLMSLPPSGIDPDPSKKEYCTYWIRTGECAYTAEGCKFKHEMPTIDKLREIGFNRVPLWWKEKNVLRGPTWMERRSSERNKEMDSNEHEQHSPQPARRPIFHEILTKEKIENGFREDMSQKEGQHIAALKKAQEAVHRVAAMPTERLFNLIDLSPVPPPSPCFSESSTTATSSEGKMNDSSDSSSTTASLETPACRKARIIIPPLASPMSLSRNHRSGDNDPQNPRNTRETNLSNELMSHILSTKVERTTTSSGPKPAFRRPSSPSRLSIPERPGLATSKHAATWAGTSDTRRRAKLLHSRSGGNRSMFSRQKRLERVPVPTSIMT